MARAQSPEFAGLELHQEPGHIRGGIEQVLDIVQDEQKLPPLECRRQRRAGRVRPNAHRLGNGIEHLIG